MSPRLKNIATFQQLNEAFKFGFFLNSYSGLHIQNGARDIILPGDHPRPLVELGQENGECQFTKNPRLVGWLESAVRASVNFHIFSTGM